MLKMSQKNDEKIDVLPTIKPREDRSSLDLPFSLNELLLSRERISPLSLSFEEFPKPIKMFMNIL